MMKSLTLLAATGLLALAACAQPASDSAADAGAVRALDASVANGVAATARGTFEGRSNHVTTGHASIARANGQWVVILEDDFTFDGAPDPRVALGRDGYDKDTNLSLLASDQGRQVYAIPANLDVADFNEVWIWCKRFNVPLGRAALRLV